jgi:DNA phosphorothioation-dependent restriction protein DptH
VATHNMLNDFTVILMENNLYFYLSQLILKYFLKRDIHHGSRYQIYFEKQDHVKNLYDCLKVFAENFYQSEMTVGKFSFYNYDSYYLEFNGKKLIVAYHPNGDLLTGLRNYFDQIEGFENNTAILFLHNTELESIIKGAENLALRGMPLHIDSVRKNIIQTFSDEEENSFSKTQKEFLRQLLNLENVDYQVESTNLFDLKKYLDILNKKQLERADYNSLGVFYDEQVQNGAVPKAQVASRLAKNNKWFTEISRNEQLGTLREYLSKVFDKDGQNKLRDPENWINVSYDDLLKYEDNRGNIKFNEYLPNTDEQNEDLDVLWDRGDGTSKSASQNRNILIFNPTHKCEVSFKLYFKRKPSIKNLSASGATAILTESENCFEVTIPLSKPQDFQNCYLHYSEEKEGKKNSYQFKVLVAPFGHHLFVGVKAIFKIQKQKNGLEFFSDSDLVFNDQGALTEPLPFESNRRYNIDDNNQLILKLDELNITDNSEFSFTLAHQQATIFARVSINGIKPIGLTGWQVWRKKTATKKSVHYATKIDEKSGRLVITLEHGNQIFFPTGEFRETLLLEEKIIDKGNAYYRLLPDNELVGFDLQLPNDLKQTYDQIISYFQHTNKGIYRLLPSTTYIDEGLKQLYVKYVQLYLHYIGQIEPNQVLSEQHLALLRIASIQDTSILNRLRFTPLHPLIIAYQLKLADRASDQDLPAQVFNKFTALNLMPFINNGVNPKDYFIAVSQEHSPEWLYYVSAQMEGQSINRKNAPEIISSKISEFFKHFSFLYIDVEAPIRINLVNVGDGLEALRGIFRHLVSTIKRLAKEEKNLMDVHPILINIYGSGNYITKFEQFSKFDDTQEIKRTFQIDLSEVEDLIHPDDLLRLYHQKVQFFIKDEQGQPQYYEYAHITFYQFNEADLEKSDNNTREISTGVSLDGIMSDLPSVFNQGNYRTGFGVRAMPEHSNILTEMSKRLNSIAHVAGTSSIFKGDIAFASVINTSVREKLTKVYENSQWITFINPMVDLSFFKNDQDVVIIHYTDQYGNSSGYDSITITTKWEQYQFILKEYLSNKVENAEGSIKSIINMFNAINGYWLLKLGSQNLYETIQKEKISILSAVKEMLAILDHDKITWVVLSLEEILRVTGSAGLSQSEGLFTKKNLEKTGPFSDDLLMVGLELVEGQLQLYYYPVEVKIGNNSADTIAKGILQGGQTFATLMETLNQKGLAGAIYRNYFAKLILTAAQKLALYEVWPGYAQKWRDIELLRGKMLNDDFVIKTLEEHIGQFAVLSFKNNEFMNRSIKFGRSEHTYLIINLYQSDGLNDLVQTVDALKDRYTAATAVGITAEDLMGSIYDLNPEALIEFRNLTKAADEDFDEPETTDIDDEVPLKLLGYEVVADPISALNIAAEPAVPYSSRPSKPLTIQFGHRASDGRVVEWLPTSTDKVMHTNTGIIGTMGTGKTQFTKSLITQLSRNGVANVDGKDIGVLIFDYKGDYIKDDFVDATKAKVYNLYHLPYNPLALFVGENPKKLLPLHTASTLQDTISKAFTLGNKQRALLKDLIMSAYAGAGIERGTESTWERAAPTIADVCEIYLHDDDASIDSLHAVLTELYDFEIFEPDGSKAIGLFELLEGVTVINLSGYSSEIQNLVVAITLDLFYSQMQNYGHSKIAGNYRQINKMILVDEADNFLSKNFESLRKILKEGREYGVGTILSTQFLNHFATSDNEYSNYILTWIIHRVNEIKEREVGSLFDLPNKADREDLITTIKGLEKHYSIVNLAGSKPIKIKDTAFWELSANRD